MPTSKIGYVQTHPVFGDRKINLREATRLVEEGVADGANADLLVFPELAVSGYEFRDREELLTLAEPFETGETSRLFKELANRHQTTLVIGYPELADDHIYNSCLLALPNGELVNYRKVQLFSREKELYTPGDKEPPVVETPAGRIGLMICFDWIFPEIARILTLKGAQIIAHPANLVLPYCQKAMYARSIENRVFTVTANRIGSENRIGRHLHFTGASQVLDPQGVTLLQAPTGLEIVSVVEINPEDADNKCMIPGNSLLQDRRVELYSRLLG